MPSQPSSGQATGLAFRPAEWELLTRLPARVMIAATSAEADSARRTVSEGLAGLDAIAAGHLSSSQLVRAVVASIYAENDDDAPAAEELNDRAASLADVLASCRTASTLLADRAAAVDAEAYRGWLVQIATAVCGAARSGGVLGVGGTQISPAERRFLTDLEAVLRP
jgi:hypothetical protein